MQLFQPDSSLPATGILFDANAVAARIRPWFGGVGDFDLSVDSIRYKPNSSCLVSYQLEAAGRTSHLHIKAFQKNDWPVRKQKLVRKLASSGDDVLIDDDLSFALFRFPIDSELPAVKKFVDDPNGFLSRVLFPHSGEQRLADFEALAYKPNRRFTARLTFESGDIGVLKMHDASTYARVLRSASILKHSLPIDTPIRLGRSNRHRALAYNWISGSELDISKKTSGECKQLLESIFDFLERLHCPLDNVNGKLEFRSPVAGVKSVAGYLEQIYPVAAPKIRKICKDISNNLNQDYRPTLIHGDFHERQVIVSGHWIRACDFDDCCLGDPSSDLANFVGHLHYRASLGEIPWGQVALIHDWSIRHFRARGGRESMLRYLWNQVAAMFRLATNSFRRGTVDWIETTERFLLQVQQQIEAIKSKSNTAISSCATVECAPQTNSWFPSKDPFNRVSKDHHHSNAAIRSDPAFEVLAEALDLQTAQRVLRQQVPRIQEIYGLYDVANIDVVRHKPGRRCLIEFELSTEHGLRSILGKASSKRLDRRTFEVQSELFESEGFGYENEDYISVPRPLGFWAPWKMWFQEKVNAKEGVAFLEDGNLVFAAERIALTLAKLHSSSFVPQRRHSISDDLRILDDRLNRAKASLPNEAHRIERIRKKCIAFGDTISQTSAVPIHRDFYHDQVLFGERQTYLVDLDLTSLGHPALDLGNFLAHLTEYGARHFDNSDHWIQEESAIVDHYVSRMPRAKNTDIAACKAISFARHIFISGTMLERNKHVSKIIEVAEKLTMQCGQRPAFAR